MRSRRVDVIIPAYNAARTIGETVGSVLRQSVVPGRVIVVDDGSTDDTAARAAARGGPVAVLRQDNRGQGSARGRGAAESSADALLFLDADDQLLPGSIERLSSALAQVPAAVLSYGRARVLSTSRAALPPEATAPLDDADGDVWGKLVLGNFIRTPGCAMVRRASLLAAGGWDPSPALQGNEDWDLWLRLAEFGPFARVDDVVLDYNVHAANFSRRRTLMMRSNIGVLRKHVGRHPPASDRAAVVRGRLAQVRRDFADALWQECRGAFNNAARRRAAALAWEAFTTHPAGVSGKLLRGWRRMPPFSPWSRATRPTVRE